MRIGTQHVSPPTATFFTVVVGAVLVCGTAFAVNFDEIKALPPVAYGWITIMGILAYPVARVLQNSAISMVGAARAVPMISLQPLLAFALGVLWLGERPNLLVTLGTPIIVVGLLIVVMPRPTARNIGSAASVRRLGYLLAVGGSLAFAVLGSVGRHVV